MMTIINNKNEKMTEASASVFLLLTTALIICEMKQFETIGNHD